MPNEFVVKNTLVVEKNIEMAPGTTIIISGSDTDSSNWDSVYTSVNATSANWDSVYTSINSSAGLSSVGPVSAADIAITSATLESTGSFVGTGLYLTLNINGSALYMPLYTR